MLAIYIYIYICIYACFSFDFLIEYNKRLFVIVYGIDEMLELYWVKIKIEFGRHRGISLTRIIKYRERDRGIEGGV